MWANDLYAAYSGGAVNEFPEISEELIREFFDSGSEPFYVLTRDDVQGYTLFENDARRVDGLAKIFPALFYLVAALVCLTTMTRMVDEERIQIGVMKALGYSAAAISVKYVAYATLAGLLGGLFGTAIGFQIFPRVIYKPYLIMYRLPPIRPVFRYEHAWPALLIAVFAIVLATVFAILKILRSRPAELMRPKPPLVGRSVPAEKVGLIWNRMSFFHKVTVRNLFRYEKRLIMTVLGIAGCTALILTGFGLRNAVNDIIDKQFSDILLHDIRVYLKDPVTDVQSDVSISLLSSIEGVEGVCPISAQTATVFGEDGEELELSLVVPADVDQFKDYFNLRERESGRPIALPADGVILSEKASKLLGLRKGDTARIEPAGSEAFEAPIVAIAENYVEHYVYMSPEYASRVFGNLEPINVLLTRTDDLDGDAADLAQDRLGDWPRICSRRGVQHHAELVAAIASGVAGIAQPGADGVGHRTQHLVADRMAVPVVGGLEVVDVEHRQRDRLTGREGAVHLVLQHRHQVAPVVQPSERVPHGLLAQVGLQRLDLLHAVAELRVAASEVGLGPAPLRDLPAGHLERAGVLERDRGLGGERHRGVGVVLVVEVGLERVEREHPGALAGEHERHSEPPSDT